MPLLLWIVGALCCVAGMYLLSTMSLLAWIGVLALCAFVGWWGWGRPSSSSSPALPSFSWDKSAAPSASASIPADVAAAAAPIGSLVTSLEKKVLPSRQQVFHISGNTHTYEDAKAVCAAHGAQLATYAQVEHAYQKGADWCSYGWSLGQMAYFPTQQKTFDALQSNPKHKNDCGRPGVNGGFFANPDVKFGVNCYGNRPAITPGERQAMHDMPLHPPTAEDLAFQAKVAEAKAHLSDTRVAPFNKTQWDQPRLVL